MKRRTTWMLLAESLLFMGLAGCGNQEEPLDAKTVTNKREPEGKPAVHKPKSVVERTSTEEQAVAQIKKLGGSVEFDKNKAVVEVHFVLGSNLTDADLDHLKGLVKLQELTVWHKSLTDSGLKHLKGLTNLRSLALGENPAVTDSGLAHLEGLDDIRHLGLEGTNITDAGLKHLKGMTKLRSLNLAWTNVTDAGLEFVKLFRNIRWLNVARTRVTDKGLQHLEGSTELEYLILGDNTGVTDSGLEHLTGLTKLIALWLDETKVTDEGVRKLQQALPNCTIHH